MFLTTPGIAEAGATNFRIMFSTYILQGSFLIAVTHSGTNEKFQNRSAAPKRSWEVSPP